MCDNPIAEASGSIIMNGVLTTQAAKFQHRQYQANGHEYETDKCEESDSFGRHWRALLVMSLK